MIAFTADIDWAPEEIIKDTLDLFYAYNVKCTLFCTHQSEVIQQADEQLFERAVHPNFNHLLNGKADSSKENLLDNLLSVYPLAKGVRSHSMLQSTLLLNLFKSRGLVYDANQFLPYHTHIFPYRCWTGLIRIPYNWEDDIHWMYNKFFNDFEPLLEGNWILNFHPVHVFLNTDCEATYQKSRIHYQDSQSLRKFRNNTEPGTRDLLTKLLSQCRSKDIKTLHLLDIAERFNNENDDSRLR